MDNQVTDFFRRQHKNYESAEANMGNSQGNWPPHGEHDMKIETITVRPMSFKLPDGTVKAAMAVTFGYIWLADPDDPDGPPEDSPFRGNPSIIVDDFPSIVPPSSCDSETRKKWEGKQTQARIAMDRFKGQMSGLLGTEATGDLVADLTSAEEMITKEDSVVISRVFCKHRESKGVIYKEDFIQQVLAK